MEVGEQHGEGDADDQTTDGGPGAEFAGLKGELLDDCTGQQHGNNVAPDGQGIDNCGHARAQLQHVCQVKQTIVGQEHQIEGIQEHPEESVQKDLTLFQALRFQLAHCSLPFNFRFEIIDVPGSKSDS